MARGRDPAVKHYADSTAEPEWLDWEALPGLERELRLEQLCRWVLTCDGRGRRFGLRLPGLIVPPGDGPEHRRMCLRALAAFV